MQTFILEIEYVGTDFHGWQKQDNANTIQEEIEKSLELILGEKTVILGSSRTDGGVHAKQQFAQFNYNNDEFDYKNLAYKLNRILPETIAIKKIIASEKNGNVRFDAIGRKYIYRISKEKIPFNREYCWHYNIDINLDLLNSLEGILIEHENFQCFSKVKTDVKTFNCKIEEARWINNKGVFEFHVQANRFLRGMVRAMVGTALEVNQGKKTIEDYISMLNSQNRGLAGPSVPAHGLTLEKVIYPSNYFSNEN